MGNDQPATEDQKKQVVAAYQAGRSVRSLAREFDANPPFIARILRLHGETIRPSRVARRIHKLNQQAFDNAERSEAAAYWAGFLMADGTISRPEKNHGHYVTLCLGEKDTGHVYKFRDFVGSDQPVRIVPSRHTTTNRPGRIRPIRTGRTAVINLTSTYMVAMLGKYGVLPRRTYYCKACYLDNNRHFWRGVVDGDGTVGMYDKAHLSLCGHECLVGQFLSYILTFSETESRVRRCSKNLWRIQLSGHVAVQVMHRLYSNCTVALDRKLATASSIISSWDLDLAKNYSGHGAIKSARCSIKAASR